MAKELKVETPQKADRYARYLTARQAADYIGVSNNYLYKLTAGHKVPFYNPTGRKLLFKRIELDAWVEAARVPADEELISRVQTEQIKKGGLL